jgi:putative peptidoglycan lipid II flippase
LRQRVQKFWYDISKDKLTIPSAAVILGVTSLLSNVLGLFRERLIATSFGATRMTDIFYASFKIPDFIFSMLVLGAVSSAFIPVFVDYVSEDKKEEANRIASNFMNFLLILTIIFGVVFFVLARKIVPFIFAGIFAGEGGAGTDTFNLLVTCVRVMLISPIFFAVSSVFGGILNSNKRFLSYAIAPLIYNISIIIGIVYFSKLTPLPIYGLLYGVLLGAFLHALVQLPETLATGFRWKPIFTLRKHELPKIIKLMIPRTLSIGVGQINILVDSFVALWFVGGLTVMNFANDVQTLPTVIFGIAIATAVFPVLASLKAPDKRREFLKVFSESARKILYFMIPATIGIIVLRAQIVRLIFGAGNFSWENTYWTTKALAFFAVGLVAQGLIPLLVRAFYSLEDTKTPLIISLIVMFVNLALSLTLPFISFLQLGVAGIALAFSIAGFVNMVLLFWFLHNKIGALDKDNRIFASTSRLVLASLVMGIVTHYSLYFFDMFVQTSTVVGLGVQTLGAVAVGGLTYLGLTHLFRVEETGIIFKRTI